MPDLQYHPLCDKFRPLTPAERSELRESLKSQGLLEPITLFKGEILDGKHRHQLCVEEHIEERFETYEGNDPLGFVEAKNLARRHLTQADKIEAMKALLRSEPELSSRAIAQQAGVSHNTVTKYRSDPNGQLTIRSEDTGPRVLTGVAPAPATSPPREAGARHGGLHEEGGQGAPAGASAPRREASGRAARGRKPSTPQMPTKTAAQKRDEMVVQITTWLNADVSNRTGDLIKILIDLGPMMQAKIVPEGRIMIMQDICKAWGLASLAGSFARVPRD